MACTWLMSVGSEGLILNKVGSRVEVAPHEITSSDYDMGGASFGRVWGQTATQ